MKDKKVALVLSGGAALGFAHLGVIKVLEKYNVPIDIVIGTSMGGLVGGCYCAGASVETMTEFACKFKNVNMFDMNFQKGGLFSGKGIMKKVAPVLPDINIEELPKTFACVACDLAAEEMVVFTKGNLREAVRSTISMPGILVPNIVDGKLLIDGGVINNMPEDIARNLGADIIISVDVLKKYKYKEDCNSIINILMCAINCATKEMQKHKALYGDIVLQPETNELQQMNFTKENTLKAIKVGEEECERNIDKILSLLK